MRTVTVTRIRTMLAVTSYLAENGVLSWELALSVLSRPPGVEVLRGTPDPNPMGLGLSVLEPDLMLDVLLTPEPRLPSSSELRDMLEP